MRSKRLGAVFFTIAALGLAIVPAYNLMALGTPSNRHEAKVALAGAYNLDFVRPWASYALFRMGISLNPKQAIVGHRQWLFLGDEYEGNISFRRSAASPSDAEIGRKILSAQQKWATWYSAHGVRSFQIEMLPDKESIYPELLPAWARWVGPSRTDTLLQAMPASMFSDTRSLLKDARAASAWPVYHKHDTHWNHYGAWVAFKATCDRIETQVHFNELPNPTFGSPTVWQGGDLSKLLYVRPLLNGDVDGPVDYPNRFIPTTQIDFGSGWPTYLTSNPEVGAPDRPLLVHSDNALNHLRVLWLRDSFGSGMSLYMASTFSDILQLHYGVATPTLIKSLVTQFHPDIVLLGFVERATRDPVLQAAP